MKKTILFLILTIPYVVFSQNFSIIDSTIHSEIISKNISGGVAFIYQNGKEVHHKAYGFSSIADHQLMDTNSIFRIASQNKGNCIYCFFTIS
jgi:CubicO group peptidase (beta-lactamase class C family)